MTDKAQVPRDALIKMIAAIEQHSCYSKDVIEQWKALAAAPQATDPRDAALCWTKGEPPKYIAEHWFIAETTYGDRLVLRALPEEYAYDYKTADDTYIKADKIKRWMQFPDSEFKSPAETALVTLTAERDALRETVEAAIPDLEQIAHFKKSLGALRIADDLRRALTTQPSKTETRDDG